jgi:hypothetical protein
VEILMLCRERMESMRLCASSMTTMWLLWERKSASEACGSGQEGKKAHSFSEIPRASRAVFCMSML